MVYTIEDGFIAPAKSAILSVKSFLQKAQAHADSASFPEKRIIADMNPLSFQVHACTHQIFWALEALTDGAIASPNDGFPKHDGFTWDQIYEHIDSALKALEDADMQYVIDNCEKVRDVNFGGFKMSLPGVKISQLMLANIFFHVTTAYDILRKEGVELGKMDFLASFMH